jgi:hypothetical protein
MEPSFQLEEKIELDMPVELLDSLLFVVGVMLKQLIARASFASSCTSLCSRYVVIRGRGIAQSHRKASPSDYRPSALDQAHTPRS